MRGDAKKPPQPPEARLRSNTGAKDRLPRRWGAWLSGDPYADLALEAIRESEYMALLESDPRYGDNEGRPPEQATTAGAAQYDPPPRQPDQPTPDQTSAGQSAA